MIRALLFIACSIFICLANSTYAQSYFPPITGNTWETIDAQSLGWQTSKISELHSFLAERKTKAFIALKDGKIIIEEYYNDHSATKPWYWASAGKTLTAGVVGIAAEQGLLNLDAPSSTYLGSNWAMVTPEQMNAITVRHHLTMSTGLDDTESFECTDPQCLKYKAVPGTRWSYHNAPYTLLDNIIEGATGSTLNMYYRQALGNKIGMAGAFIKSGYNNVFYSTGRDMARYGLLALNRGKWENTQIIPQSYADLMVNTSQTMNPSYGMLWWLNGKDKVMLPGSQLRFNGPLIATAPDDMYCALGKFDQKIYVVPSQNLVVIRLGEEAGEDSSPVPIKFDVDLWEKLSEIMNLKSSTLDNQTREKTQCHFDGQNIIVSSDNKIEKAVLIDAQGKFLRLENIDNQLKFPPHLPSGFYGLVLRSTENKKLSCGLRIVK